MGKSNTRCCYKAIMFVKKIKAISREQRTGRFGKENGLWTMNLSLFSLETINDLLYLTHFSSWPLKLLSLMKIVATMYLPPHFKLFEFYVQPKRIEFTQIILSLQSLTERINFLKVMYFAFFSLNFDFNSTSPKNS